MGVPQQENGKGKGKGNVKEEGKDAGNYDKWSNEESNELLQLLVDAAHRGWRDPQSGMIDKKTVLSKILPPFNKKLGCEKTYKHYTSRVKWFKKQYTQYSELMRHSSGFGWDPIMKKFTASEEVRMGRLLQGVATKVNKNGRRKTFYARLGDQKRIIAQEIFEQKLSLLWAEQLNWEVNFYASNY